MSIACSIVRTVQKAFDTQVWGTRGDTKTIQESTQRLPNLVRRCIAAYDAKKNEEFDLRFRELQSIIELLKDFEKMNGAALKASRDFLEGARERLQRALVTLNRSAKDAK